MVRQSAAVPEVRARKYLQCSALDIGEKRN